MPINFCLFLQRWEIHSSIEISMTVEFIDILMYAVHRYVLHFPLLIMDSAD